MLYFLHTYSIQLEMLRKKSKHRCAPQNGIQNGDHSLMACIQYTH